MRIDDANMGVYDSILVTGGGGMLAHALAVALNERGHQAKLLTRADADIRDEASLGRAFATYQPTLVLNCAAHTKVDLCEKQQADADAINGHAVGSLAKMCRDSDAMLVHFSTDYVFDGKLRRPLRPDDPVGPASAYGKSKLLGERLLQENAPARWIIARTAWLYGPGGPNFPQTMLKVARAGKPLTVIDDQHGSPTYTFDLARATLDLIDREVKGIWHLTNSDQTSWHDFAAAIFEELGVTAQLTRTTSEEYKKSKPDSAPRPTYSVLDVSPYEKLMRRPLPNWRDGLRRYRQLVEPR